jgi:hypothetical protein
LAPGPPLNFKVPAFSAGGGLQEVLFPYPWQEGCRGGYASGGQSLISKGGRTCRIDSAAHGWSRNKGDISVARGHDAFGG